MAFVVSLIDLSGKQMATAGGKARGLAQLAQAGFPVPDGFVILPAAFDQERLTAVAWTQVQTRLNAWRRRQPDITFAVRSSGHDEDSAQAAFAGQFTTLLNLATDEAVHAAIHTVYASRQNDQATAYRQDRHLNENQAMTVLVQPLIVADCAGVCFSVDPVRQLREQIVVNAAWGLGAGVMDGTITADTAWVYRHDFSLEKQHIVPKPLQLLPDEWGNRQRCRTGRTATGRLPAPGLAQARGSIRPGRRTIVWHSPGDRMGHLRAAALDSAKPSHHGPTA
jgi:phosphoenolpyruvate synthase/pyruvate phosphate dikinase